MFVSFGFNSYAEEKEEDNQKNFREVLKVDVPCLTTIIKDDDGFIWFTTQNGLVKFDGYEAQIIRKGENSISNDYVASVYEDRAGHIYIGTQGGGLNRYDKTTDSYTYYTYDADNNKSLSSDTISISKQAIFEDKDGYIWVATDNGVSRLDPTTGEFKRYQHDPTNEMTLNNNLVFSIQQDDKGQIWIGTSNGLNLYHAETDTFKRYEYNPEIESSISPGWVYTILFDNNDPEILWLGIVGGGVTRFDTVTDTFEKFPHPIGDGIDQAVGLEQYGNELWVGWYDETAGGGLSIFDKTTHQYTDYGGSASVQKESVSTLVYGLYLDDLDIMWILNVNGSLQTVDPHAQSIRSYLYDPDDVRSIGGDVILTFFEDSKGNFWFGGSDAGLNRYNPLTDDFDVYRTEIGNDKTLSSNGVMCIFEDTDGLLWLGLRGGELQVFDPEKGEVIKTYYDDEGKSDSLSPNDSIRSIIQDKDDPNILWMGSYLGTFHKFYKDSETFYNYPVEPESTDRLNNNTVVHLYQDDEGYIWVSTQGGGVLRFDKTTDQFLQLTHNPNDSNSLSSNQVWEVKQYENDILWIATVSGGLVKYTQSNHEFTTYNKENGFPANTILTIRQDDEGYMWLGSDEGLIRFNPETEAFKVFTKEDGFLGNTYLDTAALYDSRGNMWFGGVNGLNRFRPDSIVINENIPNIVLTSLKQGGEALAIDSSVERVTAIEIPWYDNYFEFGYAALNYTVAINNQYAYMLEGFDKDWYYAGTQLTGRYSGLPPGEYILRIKGSNNDGVWNEEGISLHVSIKPPFYQTFWFIALMILLGLLLVFIAYQLRISNIKKTKRKLEQLVFERTKELDQKVEEENALNEELIALNEELMDTNDKLTGMQEILVQTEKMSALGNLVAGLAHEINTPIGIGMTASSNLTQMTDELLSKSVSNHISDEERQEYLEDIGESATIIQKNLAKAGKLVKNFKVVATDQTTSQVRKFNVSSYLDEIILSHRPMLRKGDIEIDVDCDNDLSFKTDPGVLNQLISNLIMNSISHAFEGRQNKHIYIKMVEVGSIVELEYRDNGCGMDEALLSHIFEPFYTTKRASGGTGLGMYIVYNIITQQYKGKIECKSGVGEGFTVKMSWSI
jgi:signal transduction histidine kinase/ligand-binding sensor domain-containing protein